VSRIHEALKRAEEDRAAAQGAHAESSQAEEVSATPPAAGGRAIIAAVSSDSSSPSNQFSYETLLARCAPSDWSPDLKTMLFYNSEQGPGTEEFRTLRSRLYQMREKQPLKKVLVTSSLPKEGKSFVAANLAQAMVRQQGRRVLLIDADLRASRLHLALGTALTPGLSEYLMGEADEFGIMQRSAMENLFFIPAGGSTSNPAELVANGRLKILLGRVESLFDWIVIDSPPAIPVSDAGLMANHCDGVLMVVRSNATPSDLARKARAEFDDKLLLGVVLNGVKGGPSAYSEYYSAYVRPGEKAAVPR
jgi:capsular exopolysaccharide synthesis family protein